MRFGFISLCMLLTALFCGACSNSVSEIGEERDNSSSAAPAEDTPVQVKIVADSVHEGMLRVQPMGASIFLGSDDERAKASEKPRMKVTLDYDFSLGVHEFSCADYELASQMDDGLLADLECVAGNVPKVNVSYYDAVLIANAYGKAKGFDTAYTYLNRLFDQNGKCAYLEGLTFHPEVEGFRLPTEAEWVLAATVAWNPEQSWNAANSGIVRREICDFVDSVGFCDLAGNVLELTNDWLGNLRDTAVTNYAGAPVGNSLLEKVVKGGSIIQPASDMTLYNRGDVYTVSASTTTGYMGFRLAFGAIPHASWMASNGSAVGDLPVVKASSADIRQKVGTTRVKLAFRNNQTGNLAFVDYKDGRVNVVEIFDTLPVFHPEISPDGMKVAFCTGIEGVSGKSALYVRNLDADGSGLVKLDVESAAIPRWYVDASGDTSIVYVDDAGDNSDDAAFFSKATWSVPFSQGRFGKPKKILSGAYHGGVSREGHSDGIHRAVSGSKRLRVNVDGKDNVWLDGAQACNASLSGDGTDRTLFLDFGSAAGRNFAGKKYATHERLLVADSSGKLVRAIPAPDGYTFDHSEWADREDLAVVTIVNSAGAHRKIALVDVGDSSIVDLVEGEELWHPCLWAMSKSEAGNLELDSAGVYRDAVYQEGEKAMSVKMRMFWDNKDSFELIALGSSRTERGVDPLQFSMPSFNFGSVGGDLWAELYMANNYVLPHAKNLKYLVIEISPDLMSNSRSARMFTLFEQAPGYIYDRNHQFWKDSVPAEFIRIVDENNRYTVEDSLEYVNTLGLLKLESRGWGSDVQVMRDTILSQMDEKIYKKVVDSLTTFIDTTQNKGFKIIGLVYPQSPQYASTGSFGRHGTQRSLAKQTLDYFDSLSREYPHFILVDENKFGAHDYTDSMAYDFDHLSALGAERLSARLDSLLKNSP